MWKPPTHRAALHWNHAAPQQVPTLGSVFACKWISVCVLSLKEERCSRMFVHSRFCSRTSHSWGRIASLLSLKLAPARMRCESGGQTKSESGTGGQERSLDCKKKCRVYSEQTNGGVFWLRGYKSYLQGRTHKTVHKNLNIFFSLCFIKSFVHMWTQTRIPLTNLFIDKYGLRVQRWQFFSGI